VPRSPDFKADPVQHKRLSRQPLQTIVARRSNRQTDQPGAATAARLSRIHQIRELRCPFREMRVTASNVSLHSRDVAGFRDFRGHRFLVQPLASTDENASAVLVLRVGVCKPKCLLQCSGYLDTRPATANTLNFRLHRLLQRGGHDNRVAIQNGLVELLEGPSTHNENLAACSGAEEGPVSRQIPWQLALLADHAVHGAGHDERRRQPSSHLSPKMVATSSCGPRQFAGLNMAT
jgi:hypothetical protein